MEKKTYELSLQVQDIMEIAVGMQNQILYQKTICSNCFSCRVYYTLPHLFKLSVIGGKWQKSLITWILQNIQYEFLVFMSMNSNCSYKLLNNIYISSSYNTSVLIYFAWCIHFSIFSRKTPFEVRPLPFPDQ